ncbi:uncharacterized protein LOC143775113 [Ranitomeya variabilis]|uniref:uncharacterized protein LOC143775113 n=1 Tax=Ranitomeya variabilis TaxID=490064 RepID=UPI004057AAF2
MNRPAIISGSEEQPEVLEPETEQEVAIESGKLQIINLSSYSLSPGEVSVLSKGLSFSPTNPLNKFELTKDLYLFCRQLTFKLLYHKPSVIDTLLDEDRQTFRDLLELLEENERGPGESKRFTGRIPSQATPSFSLFPVVQIFFDTVSKDICNLRLRSGGLSNLTREERCCLQHLRKQDSFVIKEADKGGNVVIWPKELYVFEAKRQLSNISHYQVLPSDPTDIFKGQLDRLVRTAFDMGIINKKERGFLQLICPEYLLSTCFLRCISASTTPQPLVYSLGSYIRDSMHLMEQISDLEIPVGTYIVTLDVESLYTSIEHSLGIRAVAFFWIIKPAGIGTMILSSWTS